MKLTFRSIFFVGLMAAAVMLTAGCSVSLASDVTPPPDAQSFTSADTAVPVDTSILPIVAPDAQNGAAVYQEKCAPCHGVQGLGDGPQSSALSVEVPALGDAMLARGVRPVEWYTMVTNGNIERFMPPFKSLDDRTRWDIVAYALTLSVDDATVSQGQAIYTENCATCHGDQGEGSSQAPGWQDDPGKLAKVSISEMAAVITTGRGNMPAFTEVLSEEQIDSAASYIRWMGFNGSGAQLESASMETSGTPAPTEPFSAEVTITGEVSNSSGGELPSGLTVTLLAYDGMTETFRETAQVGADGRYDFEAVANSTTSTFMTFIEYGGVTFNSDAYHSADQPGTEIIDLPIVISDTTTDLSALHVERMHIFFDFTQAGYIQVAELFVLNNTGTQVIVSAESGKAVIEYTLPVGATNLQFQDGSLGDRYLQTETGFGDTQSIAPGSGTQVLFAYDLPYNKKMTVNIPIPLEVDSAVVMVPKGSLTLESSQVEAMGTSAVQGTDYDFFAATSLSAGSVLALTLTGASALGGMTKLSTGLIIGIVVLVVALLAAFAWLMVERRRRKAAPAESNLEEETEETIMDAIIALDDLYQSGELSEEAYQSRRSELKERLKSSLGN